MTSRKNDRPVFDASAVLALLQEEKGSDKLARVQPDAAVSAVNAAEVLAELISRGMPATEAVAAVDALHLETIAFDPHQATVSALFVKKGISLGDRCFLAAASQHGTGWTSDRDLGSLAEIQNTHLKFFR